MDTQYRPMKESTMNRREIDAVERDEVTHEELEDALKQVLLAAARVPGPERESGADAGRN